jgi:uncharacterized protein (TIGR02118 family)
MVKSIVVARKKAGMSREEFNKYWEKTHGPLAARMIPGLRRYVQNHLVDIPGMEYEGDGIVEMWYDDIDAYLKSMEYLRSDEGRPLMEDGDKFADMTDAKVWIVEEHVIL